MERYENLGMFDRNVIRVAKDVVTKKGIIPYLNTVKNNLNLSVINQVMVYIQRPDAKAVCGLKAWQELGRTKKVGAIPIVLKFPKVSLKEAPQEYVQDNMPQTIGTDDVPIYDVDPVYQNEYIAVSAYDYDSTEGDEVNISVPDVDFVDRIISITRVMPEIINASLLNGKRYLYDEIKNTFYFSDGIDLSSEYGRNEYNAAAVNMYVEYILHSYGINDKMLSNAIRYVLMERYGFKHNIEAALFMKLDKYDINQKLHFLSQLQFFTYNIVQDFEGYSLNFDETALVNDLLDTSDVTDFMITLDHVLNSIDDPFLKGEVMQLRSKLLRTEPGFVADLFTEVSNETLFTFPARNITLDETDYLFEARKIFNNL